MPSGDRPGMLSRSAAGMVASAASAITVRSGRLRPTKGARNTASQAMRSSGDSSARASASRSRTTATSASGSRFTPTKGTLLADSAARMARRCVRAPASTAMLSPGRVRTRSAIDCAAACASFCAQFSAATRYSRGSPSRLTRAATLARCRTALRRTSSASGNTRANTSLHHCTSAGAERKLRRRVSDSRCRPASPAARTVANLPTSALRKP